MRTIRHFLDYLSLSPEDAHNLGGIRWSPTGELMEQSGGRAFIFAEQISPFLNGFCSVRPVLPFAQMIQLLMIFGAGRITLDTSDEADWRMAREAFASPGTSLANLGVFCGMICEGLPSAPGAPDGREIGLWLERSQTRECLAIYAAKTNPALTAISLPQFRVFIRAKLQRFTPEILRHWLQYGSAPVGELSRPDDLFARPMSLADRLAHIVQASSRSSGALTFVPTLTAALTLPPRPSSDPTLPQGGYSDITNRGSPECLLISQLALDADEFVRRFAERELLYFRREEPRRPTVESLVLVLDQGVRTWGQVRLALAAAVLALARLSHEKGNPTSLWLSADPSTVVSLQGDEQELPELFDSANFSTHPGGLLGVALQRLHDQPSDVMLLTHPRNLHNESVMAAASLAGQNTRLFAVTVDEAGQVDFLYFRLGSWGRLSGCRLNLNQNDPPRVLPKNETFSPGHPWTGDVELVPFPFRAGIVGRILCVAHDSEGRLLVALRQGLICLRHLDGTLEFLPRAYRDSLLLDITAILPLADGFAVAGRFGDRHGVAAYFWSSHTVRAWSLDIDSMEMDDAWEISRATWFTCPRLNCLVARLELPHSVPPVSCGLDLDTGAMVADRLTNLQSSSSDQLTARARAARLEIARWHYPPPLVRLVGTHDTVDGNDGPLLFTDTLERTGTLELHGTPETWLPICPQREGRPQLKGSQIIAAHLVGRTLAVLTGPPRQLTVLKGPTTNVVWEQTLTGMDSIFAISPDERSVFWQSGSSELSQVDLASGTTTVVIGPLSCHNSLRVDLGPGWMVLSGGRYPIRLSWQSEVLITQQLPKSFSGADYLMEQKINRGIIVESSRSGQPSELSYDKKRFTDTVKNGMSVTTDRQGHAIVTDDKGELVAVFLTYRHNVVGWLPDGTRFGPSEFHLGPVHRDAPRRFAIALQKAQKLSLNAVDPSTDKPQV